MYSELSGCSVQRKAFETIHRPPILGEIAIRTHKKENLLMFCDRTVCGEMAISTTSSKRRVLYACDVLLMDGTFKYCPPYFAQLYIVFGYANDTYEHVCSPNKAVRQTETDYVQQSHTIKIIQ